MFNTNTRREIKKTDIDRHFTTSVKHKTN